MTEIEQIIRQSKIDFMDFETEWINSADRSKLPDLNIHSFTAKAIEQYVIKARIEELEVFIYNNQTFKERIVELKKDLQDNGHQKNHI